MTNKDFVTCRTLLSLVSRQHHLVFGTFQVQWINVGVRRWWESQTRLRRIPHSGVEILGQILEERRGEEYRGFLEKDSRIIHLKYELQNITLLFIFFWIITFPWAAFNHLRKLCSKQKKKNQTKSDSECIFSLFLLLRRILPKSGCNII